MEIVEEQQSKFHDDYTRAILGRTLKRIEDKRLLTGAGKYFDDIVLPNMLYAVFLRSTRAHAKISSIDVSGAVQDPNVKLVLTGIVDNVNTMPTLYSDNPLVQKGTKRYLLAPEEVNFAGEPIVLIIAKTRSSAIDACETVSVDYDPLPAVVDPLKALEENSPRVHSYWQDNVAFKTQISSGDIARAFADADHVVKAEFELQRLSAVPLETNGAIAAYDESAGFLTVWMPTQSPFSARDGIAGVLRIPETKVRIIVPDMGGSFGQKGSFSAEHATICFAATKLGQPIKWTESRSENILATSHGRGQKQFVEAAVKEDGKILGLKAMLICDGGACTEFLATLPRIILMMIPGVYNIPAFSGEALTAFTNKPPIGPYRGAGRPEATYFIERTIDLIAKKLTLDPVKVRLANYIEKDRFSFRTTGGLVYDSGDYHYNMRRAIELSDYAEMCAYQRRARAEDRLVGIGIINYVEVSSFGREFPQTASVSISKQGRVTVVLGTTPHGQGNATSLAQIVAEELGVEMRDITVLWGDTSTLPWGTITSGSRSAAVGGTAVLLATRKVKKKMAKIASSMGLGIGGGEEDLLFKEGRMCSARAPQQNKVDFREIALRAYTPSALPIGMEPTLYEYAAYAPPDNAYPFGTHIVMLEVDRDTAAINILKYVAVDDVGHVLNPMIVEGQVHGGIVQGIAEAIFEEIVYDENGVLLTSTLSDYLIPSADSSPPINCFRTETPSP